jgi:hypothetical protein
MGMLTLLKQIRDGRRFLTAAGKDIAELRAFQQTVSIAREADSAGFVAGCEGASRVPSLGTASGLDTGRVTATDP